MRSLDRRLLGASRVARRHLVGAVVLGLATALALVAQAVLLARIVSRAFLEDASLADVEADLVALAAVAVLRALLAWGFEAAGQLGAARAISELRALLVGRVLGPQPPALEAETAGELATTAVQGVDALEAYFARYLPQLVLAALVPLVVLAWVVHVDLPAAAIMAATVPLIPVFMILVGRAAERRSRERFEALSRLGGQFLDVVRGLPTLRAYGRAAAAGETLARAGERYRRETMATLRVAFVSALVLELAAMLATAMVAVVLGVRLARGGVGLEEALTVLVLAPELYQPLRQLGAQFHAAAEGLAPAARIFELVDTQAPLTLSARPARPPDLAQASIRLERVSYEYPARPGLVLEEVDLAVAPGECVALVGPSGAGKSTVLTLLLRFADPTGGRVAAGGVDLRDLEPACWREQVAWLPQRPHLFAGTVAENVMLGGADVARVWAALDAAGAEFVAELPEGISTRIGEGGRPLSAGQARRIGLARALARDAQLLLLDEPTAHLDELTARDVSDAILRLVRGRTCVVVTHDLALARRAGRVVELAAPSALGAAA
jgi:thiol reductant ABC exporter CydD subunit